MPAAAVLGNALWGKVSAATAMAACCVAEHTARYQPACTTAIIIILSSISAAAPAHRAPTPMPPGASPAPPMTSLASRTLMVTLRRTLAFRASRRSQTAGSVAGGGWTGGGGMDEPEGIEGLMHGDGGVCCVRHGAT